MASSIPPERKPFLPSFRNAKHRAGDRVCTDIVLPSKRWIAGGAYHTPAYYKSPPTDVVEERRRLAKNQPWRNPCIDVGTVQHTSIDRRTLTVKMDSDGTLRQFDARQVMQCNGGRSLCNRDMKSLSELIVKEEKLRALHSTPRAGDDDETKAAEKENKTAAVATSADPRPMTPAEEIAEIVKYGNTVPLPGMLSRPATGRVNTRPCMANLYTYHVPLSATTSSSSAQPNGQGSPQQQSPDQNSSQSSEPQPQPQTQSPVPNVSEPQPQPEVTQPASKTNDNAVTDTQDQAPADAAKDVSGDDAKSVDGAQQEGTVLLVKAADGSMQKIVVPFAVTALAVCDSQGTPKLAAEVPAKPITAGPSMPGVHTQGEQKKMLSARSARRPSTARMLRDLPARQFAGTHVPSANLPTFQFARPGSNVKPTSRVPHTQPATPEEMKYIAAVARSQTARARTSASGSSQGLPLAEWEAAGRESAEFMTFNFGNTSGFTSTRCAIPQPQLQAMVTTPAVDVRSNAFVYRT